MRKEPDRHALRNGSRGSVLFQYENPLLRPQSDAFAIKRLSINGLWYKLAEVMNGNGLLLWLNCGRTIVSDRF